MTRPATSAPPTGPRDIHRDALILEHRDLAAALARRYANRGEPADDLEQVAMIGLINAVDRFDSARGIAFPAFATPTILGELRRHFRDRTWPVHVPRGLKDDHALVTATAGALTGRLGRSPTIAEIVDEASISEERVLDALAAQGAYRPSSLSGARGADGDDEGELAIAVEEPGYHLAEGRTALRDGLAKLPPRERVILHLRFDHGMIQSDIARILGISQMHVSRLISRSLAELRRTAGGEEP